MEKRPRKKQDKPKQLSKPSLYGLHAVREAWLNPAREIDALYITAQAEKSFAQSIKDAAKLKRPRPLLIEKKQLEKMLPAGAVHQGIAISASPLEEYSLTDLIIKTRDMTQPLLLILDQVTDPHNVGAILRSACAFGADGVVIQKKHAPVLEGVLAKTACGAIEHVPVACVTNLSRSIEELQENGYFAYGLDERGEMDISELGAKAGKTALVLGAEGPGIRHNVKQHCDALVRLPMFGPMPSINVSNAAAVSLYALKA